MVADMTTASHDAEASEDILTTREVSRLLGVTPRTVDRYVSEGQLPCRYLPSGHRRFRRADVLALLTSRQSA